MRPPSWWSLFADSELEQAARGLSSFTNSLYITIIPVARTEINPFNEDSANHLPQALLLKDL